MMFDAISVTGLLLLICYQGPMYTHAYSYVHICNYIQLLYIIIFYRERERATWVCLKIGFSNLHPSANSLSTCSTAICYTQFVDGSCQGRGGSP